MHAYVALPYHMILFRYIWGRIAHGPELFQYLYTMTKRTILN